MTFNDIKQGSFLLLDCISGSRAYGLHTEQSDTDKRGVFLLPQKQFYGLHYTEQVSNASNDEVYYELKRFIDLLVKNNPNILELVNTPKDCVLYKHPLMEKVKAELFLSKLCYDTFAGYAQSQVKKARGLNKKIVNPMDKERKTVLDFCYVVHQQGSLPLKVWLAQKEWRQEDCGLVNIPHMKDLYALYYSANHPLRGVMSGTDASDVLLSSVENGAEPVAIMSFNKDGYSKYCKDYKAYWNWVEERNEVRYENTVEHGKNYDAKNMMHTFRLLLMAEEIARDGIIHVRRSDRDFLLKIRSGHYEYEDLIYKVNEKMETIDALYQKCGLPDMPDETKAEMLLAELREELYRQNALKHLKAD